MSVPSGMETAVVMQASCLLIYNRPQGVSKVCLQQARVSGAMCTPTFLTSFLIRTLLTALRSRLHSCHVQEGGPRSPQGHVVALDQKTLLTAYKGVYNTGLFERIVGVLTTCHTQ